MTNGLRLPRSVSREDLLDPESEFNRMQRSAGYGLPSIPTGPLRREPGAPVERGEPGTPGDALSLPAGALERFMANRAQRAPGRFAPPETQAAPQPPRPPAELREPQAAGPGDRQELMALLSSPPEATPASRIPPENPMARAAGAGLDAAGVENLRGPRPVSGVDELRGDRPGQNIDPRMPGPPPGAPGLSERGQAFEDTIADAPRQEELGRLHTWRGVAEGLKQAGRSMVGLSGAQIPEGDDTAYGIRDQIAQTEDQLTPAERRALESYGLKIPLGMKRSAVQEMLPAITGIQRDRMGQAEAKRERTFERSEAVLDRGSREDIAGAGVRGRAQLADTAHKRGLQKDAYTEVSKERAEWQKPTSRVGKYTSAMENLDRAIQLLEEGGRQSFHGASTLILKGGLGEAGNIGQKERDQLLAAYGGIPGVGQWFSRFFSGNMTEEQFEGLKTIAEAMKADHQQGLEKHKSERVNSLMNTNRERFSAAGITREDLMERLGTDSQEVEDAGGDTVDFRVPDWKARGYSQPILSIPKARVSAFKQEHQGAVRQAGG